MNDWQGGFLSMKEWTIRLAQKPMRSIDATSMYKKLWEIYPRKMKFPYKGPP